MFRVLRFRFKSFIRVFTSSPQSNRKIFTPSPEHERNGFRCEGTEAGRDECERRLEEMSAKEDWYILKGIFVMLLIPMVPEITFGNHTRVALDVGCVVASFRANLFSRNVLTMSVAPKDVNENQIQFALERGVPAMVATFATRRLLYPSQAFDLIHCSRCRVNSTRDGIGIRVRPCWWVCTVEMVVICYGG
ncbi:putative S-adenosyl-L-methionine-dependent methyltransferase [Helianthus annuus]|nr:putative S-adenosyl-L-methionine-dependent methyltransferase [Helianthus annuus]